MNIHQLDQMIAALRDMTTLLYEHNKKLKEAGFSDKEAFEMTVKLQNELFKQ